MPKSEDSFSTDKMKKALEKVEREEGQNLRRFDGVRAMLIKILAALGCLFFMIETCGLLLYFNVNMLDNQSNAIFMAIELTLSFLLIPASKYVDAIRTDFIQPGGVSPYSHGISFA
jgi:TRAP-type uncharacterized transport system fused permease subunit